MLPFKLSWLGYFLIIASLLLAAKAIEANDLALTPGAVLLLIPGITFVFYFNIRKVNLQDSPRLVGFVLFMFILSVDFILIHGFLSGENSPIAKLVIILFSTLSVYFLAIAIKGEWI